MQKACSLVDESNKFQRLDNHIDMNIKVDNIVKNDAPLQPHFQPDHAMANENNYVYYPNMNVIQEMTNMMSSSRSYQMNVKMLKTAKQMLQRTLNLGQ